MNPRHRRSPRNQTLNKAYPDWTSNKGVISSLTTAPWALSVSQYGLDIAYHGARSGGKFIAPVLYNFLDEDGEITQSGYAAVATMLLAKYGSKWNHLWELYNSQYNPLDSYAMTETEERDSERNITNRESTDHDNLVEYDIHETETETHDNTRTPNLSEQLTLNTRDVDTNSSTRTPNLSEAETSSTSETRTPNTTERTVIDETVESTGSDDSETTYGKVTTTESSSTNDSTLSKWGFNSADAVPASSESAESESDQTETLSGSDTTERDTTESTDRDSTQTVTTTGTETKAGQGMVTTLKTGTETLAESKENAKTGTETTLTTGTERDAGSGSATKTGDNSITTTETNVVDETGSDTYHEEVERTKAGNLFKAPAELLSIDRDFWLMDFFEIVFMDIDSTLTLSIYPEAEINNYIY